MGHLNRTTVSAGVIGALLLAGLTWKLMRPSSEREAKAGATTERVVLSNGETVDRSNNDQLSLLNEDLRKVRYELAAVKGALAARKSGRGNADGGTVKSRKYKNPAIARMTPSERDDLRKELAIETFDKLLASEPRDKAWASSQEALVPELFKEEKTSRLLDATCGSTVCRGRVAHDNEAGRREFLDAGRVFGNAPFNTNCFFTPMHETTGTVIYCSRQGHKLPRIDLNQL